LNPTLNILVPFNEAEIFQHILVFISITGFISTKFVTW